MVFIKKSNLLLKFIKYFYTYFVIFLIILVLIECVATITLKFKVFNNFNHSFLTYDFTEITNNSFFNLKKNVSMKNNVSIFTDINRLRVKVEGINKSDMKPQNPQ